MKKNHLEKELYYHESYKDEKTKIDIQSVPLSQFCADVGFNGKLYFITMHV